MPRQNKYEKDIRCPLDYGLDIITGKWNTRIISLLGHNGTMRFKDIRNEIVNISDAALSNALKDLIEKEIVKRNVLPVLPPATEYTLTEKGMSLTQIINSLCKWSGRYYTTVSDQALTQCKSCTYYIHDENCYPPEDTICPQYVRESTETEEKNGS